ncbi:hypothetical protein Ancab_000262 [Ancistrocladus abbreviatus]
METHNTARAIHFLNLHFSLLLPRIFLEWAFSVYAIVTLDGNLSSSISDLLAISVELGEFLDLVISGLIGKSRTPSSPETTRSTDWGIGGGRGIHITGMRKVSQRFDLFPCLTSSIIFAAPALLRY